jgi:tRNA dimethylallyltransferase
LYLEVLLEGSPFIHVPVDEHLRKELAGETQEELVKRFEAGEPLPFLVDKRSKKRLVRAIEIQKVISAQEQVSPGINRPIPSFPIFLTSPDRETRRTRISKRLKARLEEGLIEEVAELRSNNSDEWLVRLGLEYKFITLYLQGAISKQEMIDKLETAIHQFAKRQMTWFRRMERKGYSIEVIPDDIPFDQKVDLVLDSI